MDPPEPTTLDLDWASLHTIQLSLLDSRIRKLSRILSSSPKLRLRKMGSFICPITASHWTNCIDSLILRNIRTATCRKRTKRGSYGTHPRCRFAGFKPRYGWKRERGAFDGIEQFNFYSSEFADPEAKVPECLRLFIDEIHSFSHVSIRPSKRIVHHLVA